jgi:hypothetical protein
MALFDSELTTAAEAAIRIISEADQLSSLGNAATERAFGAIATYPSFIFGPNGLCSSNGCQDVNIQSIAYGQSVLNAVLTQFGSDIPPPIVTAARGVDTTDLVTCFCGGTMDWGRSFRGIADTFGLIPTAPANAPAPTLEQTVGAFRPLIAGVLSSIFSPYGFCSSASCKRVTADIMALVDALKSSFVADQPWLGTELSFADIAWCPTNAFSGSKLTQVFTIGGTVEAFNDAQQTLFKEKFVDAINAGSGNQFLKLTAGQVSLTISSGSVNVEASIDVSSPSLYAATAASLSTLASSTPADLTTTLGVTVEAAAAPQTQAIAEGTDSGGGGGSSNTGAIAGGVAAGVVVLVLVLAAMMMMMKKKQAAAPPQFDTVVHTKGPQAVA